MDPEDKLVHQDDTIYFTDIGLKDKVKTSDIEDILSSHTFEKLDFKRCNSSKVYKKTFAYLMHNHHQINTIQIDVIHHSIFTSILSNLCDFLCSSSCSSLIELLITSDIFTPDLNNLLVTLSKSKSLQTSLQRLKIGTFGNAEKNASIKIDKTLSNFLFNASVTNKSLKVLNLRNIGFTAKQNYDLSFALCNCLWPNGKKKKRSNRCSITEFYFGGSDNWNQKGMEKMCRFIKYNRNLEILGVDLLNASKDRPFISDDDATSIGVFVLSINDHPSLQRLEVYHIQTYTLKVFGDQFENRIKGKSTKKNFDLTAMIITLSFEQETRCGLASYTCNKFMKIRVWIQNVILCYLRY